MKKVFTLFAAIAMTVSAMAQTTATFNASAQGWANAYTPTTSTVVSIDANLSITNINKNGSSNDPAYYTADNSLRFYSVSGGNGGGFTITPSNGAVITDVTMNGVTGNVAPATYYIDGSTTGTVATLSGTTYTISGVNAAVSLRIKNSAPAASNQMRITSFTVTYTMGGSLATTEIVKVNNPFVRNTYVKSDINFGSAAKDVKIHNMFGQVVRTVSVKDGETVNVSDLPKGNYIVTGTVNNNPVSQKILKD